MDKKEDFEKLPLKERIVITTSSQLIKHVRGLESANLLNREQAAKLIGCVRKLSAIANGEEVKESELAPGKKIIIN